MLWPKKCSYPGCTANISVNSTHKWFFHGNQSNFICKMSGVSGGRERYPSTGMHRVDSTTDLSTYQGCGEGGSTKLQVGMDAADWFWIQVSVQGIILTVLRLFRKHFLKETCLTTGHHQLWTLGYKLSPGGCGVDTGHLGYGCQEVKGENSSLVS